MTNDGWGNEFKPKSVGELKLVSPKGDCFPDGWGKGDWGKQVIIDFKSDDPIPVEELLTPKSDWGAFPVIPTRKTTKFTPDVEQPTANEALDLSEQPFEFDQELEATRIGDLCVHRSTEDVGKWRVTHVHSLYSFMKAVPQGEWSKEQLKAWCKTVQLNWQDYWQVLREVSENQLHLTDRQRYSAGILQKHCLQTPVE